MKPILTVPRNIFVSLIFNENGGTPETTLRVAVHSVYPWNGCQQNNALGFCNLLQAVWIYNYTGTTALSEQFNEQS